ncbi:MAG: hypothetical protein GEU82_18250 [Luteitalea sp.]|nr:hypothetical protein [Luteitalea sp.]
MALLWLIAAAPARAQFDSGAVPGTVRDTSGGVLPGVTVTLLNTDTGIVLTRTTDDRGAYEFVTVRVGNYSVKAELPGFTPRDVDRDAVVLPTDPSRPFRERAP